MIFITKISLIYTCHSFDLTLNTDDLAVIYGLPAVHGWVKNTAFFPTAAFCRPHCHLWTTLSNQRIRHIWYACRSIFLRPLQPNPSNRPTPNAAHCTTRQNHSNFQKKKMGEKRVDRSADSFCVRYNHIEIHPALPVLDELCSDSIGLGLQLQVTEWKMITCSRYLLRYVVTFLELYLVTVFNQSINQPLLLKFWVNRPPFKRNNRFWTDIRSYRLSRNT